MQRLFFRIITHWAGDGQKIMLGHIQGRYPNNAYMWTAMQSAIETHGLKLDIVFEDSACPLPPKNQTVYNMTDIG